MNLSDNFKKFMGIVDDVTSVAKAVPAAIDIGIINEPTWGEHATVDLAFTKPHFDKLYGGHNRKSRNAGSFYGGYDIATRFPEKLEELKTLAKGYQMWSALTRVGKEGASYADEMEDALANISGIEAAQRDMKIGKKYTLGTEFNQEIADLAKNYADTYTNNKE